MKSVRVCLDTSAEDRKKCVCVCDLSHRRPDTRPYQRRPKKCDVAGSRVELRLPKSLAVEVEDVIATPD